MNSQQQSSQKSGFTLVELMVVVAVIVILATLSALSYRSAKNQSHDTAVQADIRNFATKVEEHEAYEDSLPKGSGNLGAAPTTAPVGMENYQVSQASYDTDVRNFYYCHGTVNGEEKYAVGAVSKSGTAFYITSDHGVKEYTGTWTTSTAICPGMLPGLDAEGRTFSYGYTPNAWRPWVK